MKKLLQSRKFLAALMGVVVLVLVEFGVAEDRAYMLAENVTWIIMVLIGAQSFEDAAGRFGKTDG